MTEKVLCVDDDPNILQAYQRGLHKRFHIDVALGGDEALAAVVREGPYAVVVSDMRMPSMNGVELLKRIKQHAPDTVRMMLTGNADQQTALEAVNEGHIFRFLTKPCPPENFAQALDAGLRQYQLIRTERDMLAKTFGACVKVLTDVLSAVSPAAFGKAARVRETVRQLCRELDVRDWQIEVAAMLSLVGCVSIPAELLAKAYDGKELTEGERQIFRAYPQASRELIAHIPRLEQVTEIIGYQQQNFDGSGFPGDGRCGDQIPLGSRILKVALDYDVLRSAGCSREIAVADIHDRGDMYDPQVVAALDKVLAIINCQVLRQVGVSQLVDGLTLAEDIKTTSGTLLCARGQQVTRAIRVRLRNSWGNMCISSSIRVFVPKEMASCFSESATL